MGDSKAPWSGQLPPLKRWPIWHLGLMLLFLWLWQQLLHYAVYKPIPYSEFKERLSRGEVTEATIRENEIEGRIEPKAPVASEGQPPPLASEPFSFRTTRLEDPKLVEEMQDAGVKFTGVRPSLISEILWAWLLPIGAMVLIWMLLSRRLKAGGGESLLSIGKSRAKLVADRASGVTFGDVAGCDEAKLELGEVVDFLRNPGRYQALGAKIPKGVLLVGPPGTGKTLLGRAVAGEAKVPFFSISGSDFVEMFVGVGAARVRDLFLQAKAQAPCIIFIDELDAIGRQRSVHVGNANDEREQTLNQLLVELDGFEANVNVIVLAATNRPDVLDRALLRPGRFDRQVIIDAPDLDGREAVLRIHAKGKPIDPMADLRRVAQITVGFSGADLANTMNEAALLTARRGSHEITQRDLEEAVEKVVAGPERRSRRMTDAQKRRVAFHEVGHALVATYCEDADPVHKISIVPRGKAALGYTLQRPDEDRLMLTRGALYDRIKSALGGRAAEALVFETITTGAENDLEQATAIARQMVCFYGMSERVGLMHCGRAARGPVLLAEVEGVMQRDCSEETAREIDREVRQLLSSAYADAVKTLGEHRQQLDIIANELLKRETLDFDTFRRLLADTASAPDKKPLPMAWVPRAKQDEN